ncbi:hypothetical protein [Tanticharoenia sakaeratensis]|uniref:Uncharacterized protein n=1 Tax=Tanticharoenia sakaeratensis NBRC 103193 TaxID=1231623 RepID=A0A0D6MLH6_9PROT|nr:hypothetical protein [Tanticharoenia sakaeratensis]GAN54245.1 hypothetical protein Tasa_017_128 [Tanticharoenia sakaeratensis NBRC 103193]GBQ19174.1 hypothetical protein AA103193_0938 [Tanticharoenia sakaeratensis NBRC 103193]
MRLIKILAVAVPVLLIGGLGAGFLSLGANAVPPEQTTVHKDFPAGRFAVTPQAPSLASVMPQPSSPANGPAPSVQAPPAATPPAGQRATSAAH